LPGLNKSPLEPNGSSGLFVTTVPLLCKLVKDSHGRPDPRVI
jgi:hypothetical protein